MTYASAGTIQAADYNTIAANVNAIWSTGNGSSGYGQTAVTNVTAVTDSVTATQWTSIFAKISSMGSHQGSSLATLVSSVSAGSVVTYYANTNTNITTLTTNKLNAAANGTDLAAVTKDTSWVSATPTSISSTVVVTFQNADSARYFFNAGGKLRVTFSQPNAAVTNTKTTDWAQLLATNLGTFQFGATSSSITGNGTVTSNTLASNGYYQLTSSPVVLAKVSSTSTTADYASNYVNVAVSYTGVLGSNGDKSPQVTFTFTYVDGAADSAFSDNVNFGIRTSTVVRPPSTTYLSNVWSNSSAVTVA
jgi:hypothetical protein